MNEKKKNTVLLSRGVFSLLYREYDFFDFSITDSNDTFKPLPNSILKISKKRCTMQTLSTKQHLHSSTSRDELKSFLFPQNETVSLALLSPKTIQTIWNEFPWYVRHAHAPEDFVVQSMPYGGVPWNRCSFAVTDKQKYEFLRAVHTLHRCRVTHNDILDRNVLIDQSGNVRLIDWDFSVIHYDDGGETEPLLNNLGPFSWFRAAEVLDHFHHTFTEQIRFDWKRTWAIIGAFQDITWQTIEEKMKSNPKQSYDAYIKTLLEEWNRKEKQTMQPKQKSVTVT